MHSQARLSLFSHIFYKFFYKLYYGLYYYSVSLNTTARPANITVIESKLYENYALSFHIIF